MLMVKLREVPMVQSAERIMCSLPKQYVAVGSNDKVQQIERILHSIHETCYNPSL